MGIIAWLRRRSLERRKKGYAGRLSEIRTNLRKLKTPDPRMRFAIQSELARIRELKKQLNKVKSEEELRFWYSLFNMCVPSFKALLSFSRPHTQMRKIKKGGKK